MSIRINYLDLVRSRGEGALRLVARTIWDRGRESRARTHANEIESRIRTLKDDAFKLFLTGTWRET